MGAKKHDSLFFHSQLVIAVPTSFTHPTTELFLHICLSFAGSQPCIEISFLSSTVQQKERNRLSPRFFSLLNPALKTELNHSSQWAKSKRGGKNPFHAHSDVHLQSIGGCMDGMKKRINDGEGAIAHPQFFLLPLSIAF